MSNYGPCTERVETFLASLTAFPYFQPAKDTKPKPEWKHFQSRAAAWAAARTAAENAAGNAAENAAWNAALDAAAGVAAGAAAGTAARDAAGDAAGDAAWYAARTAAETAARNVAWAAAGVAAGAAAKAAAGTAARDAAWNAAEDAAWAAARDAAWDAAGAAAWYARLKVVSDLDYPNKAQHEAHIAARMDVWRMGYGLLCDVHGVLYTYEKIIAAEVPVVEDLEQKMAAVCMCEGALKMDYWHTCETTHCRAGWAITLAGAAGKALEKEVGPHGAGALIYLKNTGRVPDFFATNEDAMKDILASAEAEKAKKEAK